MRAFGSSYFFSGFPGGLVVKKKKYVANARDVRDVGLITGLEDSLEVGMATHSNILAWRIPWTEEPGGLQSMGSCREELNTTE